MKVAILDAVLDAVLEPVDIGLVRFVATATAKPLAALKDVGTDLYVRVNPQGRAVGMPVAGAVGLAVALVLGTEVTSLIGVAAKGIGAPTEGNATTLIDVLFTLLWPSPMRLFTRS